MRCGFRTRWPSISSRVDFGRDGRSSRRAYASGMTREEAWPELPLAAWQDTYATLHLWTQIIGKIRMAQTPYLNHWWHVTLYVSANGLTTSVMPHGLRAF